MPEVGLEVLIWWVTARFPTHMPFGSALEFLLTDNRVTAQQAEHCGPVNHVVPHDKLMSKTEEMTRKANSNGPLAVRSMNEVLY